jgi:transposase
MFSYINLEKRVPQNHSLRRLKSFTDRILTNLSHHFDLIYSDYGCPSIPPEQLLRASLLQIFYTIRSERQLMEHIDANLWYRWFVGLGIDDKVWNHSLFSKNRDRLLEGEIAQKFFQEVLEIAKEHDLVSDEHFSVDGSLIESYASQKSFKPKDKNNKPPRGKNDDVNFHKEKRKNDTHQSTTDPDARLYRKGLGKEAKLVFIGNIINENRNNLVVETLLNQATGTAEREASLDMIDKIKPVSKRITLGGDKGYDVKEYTEKLREKNVTSHPAMNDKNRKSSIDGRTYRHKGYNVSQKKRKKIEEFFGWAKCVGGLRKFRHKGMELLNWIFKLTAASYNLIRMTKLISA